jgi:hypothetical protein
MDEDDQVYVLMKSGATALQQAQPVIAHTTWQGAAMEMSPYTAEQQLGMWVHTVRLIRD